MRRIFSFLCVGLVNLSPVVVEFVIFHVWPTPNCEHNCVVIFLGVHSKWHVAGVLVGR